MKRVIAILIMLPLLAGFAPPEGPTKKGNDAYRAGRYDDALREYQKAVEENPGKAGAHYNLGNAYYKKGEFDKALGEYNEAIRIDPEMADAHYNAGNSLFRLGQFERAMGEYRRADELRRKDSDTVHNMEVTARRLEKQKQEQSPQDSDMEKEQQPGAGRQQPQAGGRGDEDKKGRGEGGSEAAAQAPPMGEDELRALLEKQADEEKRLQRFFRPGGKADKDEVDEAIEQMLRDSGFNAPAARAPSPGEPYVEKDW